MIDLDRWLQLPDLEALSAFARNMTWCWLRIDERLRRNARAERRAGRERAPAERRADEGT